MSMIKKYRYEYGSELIIGATINLARNNEYRIVKKKIESGADFFITQALYSESMIIENKWVKHLSLPIYIGLIPILSKKLLNFYARNLSIPENLFNLLKKSENIKRENLFLFSAIIEKTSDIVDGYHIMPLDNMDFVEEVMKKVKKC